MKKQALIILCISFFILRSVHAQWTKSMSIEGGSIEFLLKHGNKAVAITESSEVYTTESDVWSYSSILQDIYSNPESCGSYIIVGTNQGVIRSADNGKTWERTQNNGLNSISSFGVFNTEVYALDYDRQLFKSTDYGDSYTAVTGFLNDANLFYNQIISANNKLYIVGDSLIKVSVNGNTFSDISTTGLPSRAPRYNLIGDGTSIYLITYGSMETGFGIYKYNGLSWLAIKNGLPPIGFYTNLCFLNNALYVSAYDEAGSLFGVYISTNNGVTWSKTAGAGLKINFAKSLIALNPTTILGSFVDGLYISTNKGSSWSFMSKGIYATEHEEIFASGNTVITYDFSRGILKSVDGGTTFSIATSGVTADISVYGTLAKSSDAYYTLTGNFEMPTTLYRSINDASSWTKVNMPVVNSYMEIVATQGSILYAYSNDELYRSIDKAQTWQSINSSLPSEGDYYNLIGDDEAVYAYNEKNIYRSTNNGTNWQIDTIGLNSNFISKITYTGSSLYLVAANFGQQQLYKRGLNKWQLIGNFELNEAGAQGVDKLYMYNNIMYATSYSVDNPLYVSSNNGAGFIPYANGFNSNVDINALAFSGNKIVAATNNGIWSNNTFTGITGLDEKELIEKITFMVYPNPASETANINYVIKEEGAISLSLYDISGKKIMDIDSENKVPGLYHEKIELKGLNPGLYLVRLSTSLGEYSTRLIVR